ncbi:MAG: hypothetical protein A2452_07180 [Candidatus Firestonebacteria bacterium RIFOXYC2_FULL_39_67]|nr:MAG: hypothetical protein A2536_04840 [Candidatus Firestonebacteria bacterium RIFOXYD2_FULL_39_29]OGF51957.1 MAG: hypothetical protein A2497_06995 [Candidatus Firestonebacteria bacterium RifOxyC12_full_39_7]OGF54839.1 MAG: hypothetical protein A2452_07180 [Candidatus Firestonebacteria bacterium RIFOXYC2_FULL_39_67]
MLKTINQAVINDRPYLITLLGKLVEIPTISEPGVNYGRFVKVLEKECKKIGLKTKIIKVTDKKFINSLKEECRKNPRYILMAYWNTGAKKTLHFNGHYDVVPASLGFSKNPFKLNIKGDKIIARGAADMKSGIVAMLSAVRALKILKIKPAWNLEFSFVPDEEIGGYCGSGYICHKKIPKADVVIEGDGGGGNSLTVAHRGIVGFRVTVIGKAVHAALHTKGVNAFLKAVKIVNELEIFRNKIEKRKSKYYAKAPISKIATMMIGGLSSGGLKSNSVPDKFTFTIDRRVIPEESMKKARKEIVDLINSVVKKDGTFKVKIEVSEATHSSIEKDAPICKLLGSILEEYYGRKPLMLITGGRLDSAFFSQVLKKPTLAFGVNGTNYHADDEYTTGKDIITAAAIYARLMCKGY